jgi:hypothetical protein
MPRERRWSIADIDRIKRRMRVTREYQRRIAEAYSDPGRLSAVIQEGFPPSYHIEIVFGYDWALYRLADHALGGSVRRRTRQQAALQPMEMPQARQWAGYRRTAGRRWSGRELLALRYMLRAGIGTGDAWSIYNRSYDRRTQRSFTTKYARYRSAEGFAERRIRPRRLPRPLRERYGVE